MGKHLVNDKLPNTFFLSSCVNSFFINATGCQNFLWPESPTLCNPPSKQASIYSKTQDLFILWNSSFSRSPTLAFRISQVKSPTQLAERSCPSASTTGGRRPSRHTAPRIAETKMTNPASHTPSSLSFSACAGDPRHLPSRFPSSPTYSLLECQSRHHQHCPVWNKGVGVRGDDQKGPFHYTSKTSNIFLSTMCPQN